MPVETDITMDEQVESIERAPEQTEERSGLAAVEAELALEMGPDEADEQEAPLKEAWQGELPDMLMNIVDARISIWRKMIALEDRRGELRPLAEVRDIRDELNRQSREFQKVPGWEILAKALRKVKERIANPQIKGEIPAPSPKAKEPPPNPHELFKKVLGMGLEQLEMLVRRVKFDSVIPTAAMPAAEAEPLLQVCRKYNIAADKMVGWTYYALGLSQRIDQYRAIEKQHMEKISAARAEDKKNNRGLKGLLSGPSRESMIKPLDGNVVEALAAARREMKVIEPDLTEIYWKLYEELAPLLGQEELDPDDEVTVRAFLRYGLVVRHPGMIDPQTAEYIVRDCREDVYHWDNSPGQTHVTYADEYLQAIANFDLVLSPDEDLELNDRGSDTWKADRICRQAVSCTSRLELFQTRLDELKAEVDAGQEEVAQKQEKLAELKMDKRKKDKAGLLAMEVTAQQAHLARLRNAAELIEERIMPKIDYQAKDAEGKLEGELEKYTPEMIARKQAQFVRRMARLAARLKEPFPQFTLRDYFKPDGNDHHGRKAMLEVLAEHEKADVRIFHHLLVPNKKMDRQITVRMSPVFLISPGRGQMGFCISHRKWDDNGRFVLPMIGQRQNALRQMLCNVLADFRWDCSKEEAGMDWITADALCAGYAACRWNVRKFPEKAQKAMGFEPKLKDKPNFREHYRMFVASAEESGRQLFGKCEEVYKIVIKYIGLPPGIEVLKRD